MYMSLLSFGMVGLFACSENEIIKRPFDDIAVIDGDFDHFGEVLTRMDIAHDSYDGFISQAVYNPEEDGSLNGYKVENLFMDTDEAERTIMLDYDAIFLNSGVRGLGSYVYNGVENDDMFLLDEQALENVRTFVQAGRTLIVSDWAGDLIEQVWPGKINFVNEDNCFAEECFDIAQAGSNENIIASIEDDNLMNQLEVDSIQLQFDYSYWTGMQDVSDDVDVFLRGDITYRTSEGEGYLDMTDVPLLVGFQDASGYVLFSSFHYRAQNTNVVDTTLLTIIDGLKPGSSYEN
jgi:hypothetical protein